MEKLVEKYLNLIDDIVTDFLTDIKSLRYQLILWAFGFNLYILNLISQNKADYKLAVAGIGLLTLVYGMYFQSKKHQAEMEAKQTAEEDEPSVERDPEAE